MILTVAGDQREHLRIPGQHDTMSVLGLRCPTLELACDQLVQLRFAERQKVKHLIDTT